MTPDRDYFAAMSAGIPPIGTPDPIAADEADPMRPDALDVIHMDNDAIEDVRDSAERAEETGELPRMDYGRTNEDRNDDRR